MSNGRKVRAKKPVKGSSRIQAKCNAKGSTNQSTPVFCLKNLTSPYSIDDCENEDKVALLTTIHKLCKLEWSEIGRSGRHGCGTEKIARTSLNVAVPASISEDVNLLAFRFNGKKAMVGYRNGIIFHILFIDHNFSVYAH